MATVTMDYDFKHKGKHYSCVGIFAGDTIDTILDPVEWIGSAVYHALEEEYEDNREFLESLHSVNDWLDAGFEIKDISVQIGDAEFVL